jgi:hypothetical protein
MTTPFGLYCGPYWSDGKVQKSVAGKATPVSEFDATCKAHDRAYALSDNPVDLNLADKQFVDENMHKGPLRTAAALAVSANKYLRSGGVKLRGAVRDTPAKSKAMTVTKVGNCTASGGTCSGKVPARPKRLYPSKRSIRLITKLDQLNLNKKLNTKTNMTRLSKKNGGANGKRGSVAVAYSRTVDIPAPRIGTRSDGRIVVKHREYLAPVLGSTGLRITSQNLNPGLGGTFPWLYNIAANYEKYKILKLSVHYITSSGTTAGGRVGLAFGYNPSEKIPLNKQEFFSIVPNREEAPWEDITLTVQPTGETKYIRFASVYDGTVNTYDMGRIILMVDNTASGLAIGDLFIEYEVELLRPHYGRIQSEWLTIQLPGNGVPMGVGFALYKGIELVSWVNASSLQFEVPGDYEIVYFMAGDTTAPLTASWSLTPINSSQLQQEVINTCMDTTGALFNLTYMVLFKNAQVGDRISYQGNYWDMTAGGLTITKMSQH